MACVVNRINKTVEKAFAEGRMLDTVEISEAEHAWLADQLQKPEVDEVLTDFGLIKLTLRFAET